MEEEKLEGKKMKRIWRWMNENKVSIEWRRTEMKKNYENNYENEETILIPFNSIVSLMNIFSRFYWLMFRIIGGLDIWVFDCCLKLA